MLIQDDIIRRAGQAQGFPGVVGVRGVEGGQGIGPVVPALGEVVPDVIGILLGEPDGPIRRGNTAHDPPLAARAASCCQNLPVWGLNEPR